MNERKVIKDAVLSYMREHDTWSVDDMLISIKQTLTNQISVRWFNEPDILSNVILNIADDLFRRGFVVRIKVDDAIYAKSVGPTCG